MLSIDEYYHIIKPQYLRFIRPIVYRPGLRDGTGSQGCSLVISHHIRQRNEAVSAYIFLGDEDFSPEMHVRSFNFNIFLILYMQ